ncbi:hypothetical protein HD554DRAFT_1780831 [Boletus coccyginus]|nr:hypothetical protein HD554DRAFT_1780831 [Boletus coccyginus]
MQVTATISTQCIFPAELIVDILSYTDPRDIIRWRTVSKWFRAITYDPAMWNILYGNAPFVCPPGPFPSAASLERSLVRSARLAQSWTTPSLRIVSHVVIPFYGQPQRDSRVDEVNLVCGRWFITRWRVPQILWEKGKWIHRWASCSMISEDGNLVIYVILCEQHSQQHQWKFSEFRINGESGLLCDTIPIDFPERGVVDSDVTPYIVGHLKQSPFLVIEPLYLVFDTRTRLFHELPKFRIAMEETRHEIKISDRVNQGWYILCTNTHIFCVFPYLFRPHTTLIQAFTAPDDPPLGENNLGGVLRISHEGILFHRAPCVVIRNSIVDPITGSIGVRFLDQSCGYIVRCLNLECIDVTLHKPSLVDVSPITFHWHTVVTRVNEPLCQDFWCKSNFWDSLADGYVRGLLTHHCSRSTYPNTAICHEKQSAIIKFTIDATRDCCVATLCRFLFPLPVEWERHRCLREFPDNDRAQWGVYFDCIRGKARHIRVMGKNDLLLDVLDVE